MPQDLAPVVDAGHFLLTTTLHLNPSLPSIAVDTAHVFLSKQQPQSTFSFLSCSRDQITLGC